ncbi:MAG: hypothetical protein WCA32_18750 [Chromatiaceae bacterium]|jgi:hypothetical protein
MAESRYDIVFAGELAPGTNPAEARRRIQVLFRLSDEAAQRLFGDRPTTIKRGVDSAAVARYREAFREAGAFIRVEPVPTSSDLLPTAVKAAPQETDAKPKPRSHTTPRSSGLQLAPLDDDRPLEPPQMVKPRQVDISYLSLVPGSDWTLADCEQPPPPLSLPDISHLRLVEA